MEAGSETQGGARRQVAAVTKRPEMPRRDGEASCGVSRRSVLFMASGVLFSVTLTACGDKPPPAEVTPFAFPAVGAGQKDTAQFGARSGPTVP